MMVALENSFVQPSFDWDPHSFVGGGAHQDLHGLLTLTTVLDTTSSSSLSLHTVMEESPSSSTRASTGYLQDAVAGCGTADRYKRMRVLDEKKIDHGAMMVTEELQELLQGFWDSKWSGDPLENLSSVVEDDHKLSLDNPWRSLAPLRGNITQEATAPPQPSHPSSSIKVRALEETETEQRKNRRKKKKAMGVVYPFTVVKSGGLEGDVTLSDINERMLMPPTRAVHHPVGEFACAPCVSTAAGPGLSGKAVVGLTRIHTHQGRGTITIIRTRG